MNINENTLNNILTRFDRDVNSYGFGGVHDEIINICKDLQCQGVDLTPYYNLNHKINPPYSHDIKTPFFK